MTAVLHQPVEGDADVSALAAVIGEPARAKILLTLTDGRALPASVLAAEAGVAPSTASSHLACLLDAGLLTCLPQGRHRYYSLAGPQVGELIEALARLSPPAPVRSLREGTRAAALRAARTCYDHLAGLLGVEVFGHLATNGDIVGGDGRHQRDCLDWTEQQHHLSGTVGRALTGRLLDLGWLRRAPRGRAVHVTDDGRAGMVAAGLLAA